MLELASAWKSQIQQQDRALFSSMAHISQGPSESSRFTSGDTRVAIS